MYKREMGAIKDLLVENDSLLESLEAHMKAKQEEFPDHSLFLQAFFQGKKYFVESTKNNAIKRDEEMRAQIDYKEKELEKLRKLITLHEEQQAEL